MYLLLLFRICWHHNWRIPSIFLTWPQPGDHCFETFLTEVSDLVKGKMEEVELQVQFFLDFFCIAAVTPPNMNFK